MALSGLAKLGYALQGTLTGVAANIEKEEERRDKASNTVLAGIIKNADTAMELSTQSIKEKKEFDAQVETLKGRTYIDPVTNKRQQITEAQAIYALNTYGKDLFEKLQKNEIAFSTKGNVVKTPPSLKGKLPNPLDMPEDKENFLFYKGRQQAIVSDAVEQARAMGYDTEGYPIVSKPTATGVDELPGIGMYNRSEQMLYEFEKTGELVKAFKQVTLTNKTNPNETKTFNVDFLTNEKVELGSNTQIFPNINAGKVKGIDDIGTVMIPGDSGYMPLMREGKPVKAFQMENGQIRVEAPDGTPGELIDIEGAQLFGTKMSQATGTDINDFLNFSKVIGVKEFNVENVKFMQLGETMASVNERVGFMMKLNQEIGDAGYSVGGFLTTLTNSSIKAVNSVGAFMSGFSESDNLQGNSEEAQTARYNYIANEEGALRGFVASAEEMLAGAKDAVEERAIKIALLETESILLAYDAAKATGDTRISNQDFDAFIKTIKGTSVKETFAKLERLHERTLFKYEQNWKTVNRLADNIPIQDIPEGTNLRQYIDNAKIKAGDERHPDTIRGKFAVVADQYRPQTQATTQTTAPTYVLRTQNNTVIATVDVPGIGDVEFPVPSNIDPTTPQGKQDLEKMIQDTISQATAQ